jgi:uncharacterized protein
MTGVMTEATTARDAMAMNTVSMKRVLDGLKSVGIEAKDIQTTALQISPRFGQQRGDKPPIVNGYIATNQVRILVRDLARLGDILDQSISLGANQMGGIAFEVTAADTLKDEARKLAVANARRRAELYATAGGVALGQVLAISESQHAPQNHGAMASRSQQSSAVPLEAGSVELSVEVHISWAIK